MQAKIGKKVECELNCLPLCKLDDNKNKISHLQNHFNDESVSSVISNLHLNSYPDKHYYKDKETESLLSVKTINNNPKEIDRKKHVITVITQSSKKKS